MGAVPENPEADSPSPDPDNFYIQWHITDRCNLRCRHCYQPGFETIGELDLARLQQIANNLLATMTRWDLKLDVAITGGEPLLRPESILLLKYLDANPQIGQLGLITNGTRLAALAGQLAGISRLHEIKISIDGISPATHDAIRGPGTFDQVLENLGAIRNLAVKKIAMFTVMRRNLGDIPGLLDFCRRAGFDGVIVERFFPLGQGATLTGEVLSGEEFWQVWQTLLQQTDCAAGPEEVIGYRAIRVDFRAADTDISGSACIVGIDGCAVMPDGTVYPCRRFPLALGNLQTTPLWKIWEDAPMLVAMRDKSKLKGHCRNCPLEDCRGCRAMAFCFSADPLGPDPHCWLN
jgi:radical SAM protein with 4Fe4S-binding SPASM domain